MTGRKILALVALALTGAMPVHAQADRSIPSGSPLGNLPIARTPAGAVPAADPDDAWLRAQQAAVARARAAERERQMQAAYAPLPRPAPTDDVDPPAPRSATVEADAPSNRGPIPTPFGGGIRTPWDRR